MTRLLLAIAAAAVAIASGRRNKLRRKTDRRPVYDNFTMTHPEHPKHDEDKPGES